MKYCDQRIDEALWLRPALSATAKLGVRRQSEATTPLWISVGFEFCSKYHLQAKPDPKRRQSRRTPNISFAALSSLMYHRCKSKEDLNENSNRQRSRRFCRERTVEAFAD
jgi:hypothetical protein